MVREPQLCDNITWELWHILPEVTLSGLRNNALDCTVVDGDY